MLVIPTAEEARFYAEHVNSNPELKDTLHTVITAIQTARGANTWVGQEAIPSAQFSTVKRLLALKHWRLEAGFNSEESYHYYSIERCTCACCAARTA